MTWEELENRMLINEYKILCDLAGEDDEEIAIRRAMCAVKMSMFGLEEYLRPEDKAAMSDKKDRES